jgi:hypothetical protein
MDLKLSETSEIGGSSESDHKTAFFWELMSRDQFNTLMMEVAVSPEALVHVYHSTHFLPGYKLLH